MDHLMCAPLFSDTNNHGTRSFRVRIFQGNIDGLHVSGHSSSGNEFPQTSSVLSPNRRIIGCVERYFRVQYVWMDIYALGTLTQDYLMTRNHRSVFVSAFPKAVCSARVVSKASIVCYFCYNVLIVLSIRGGELFHLCPTDHHKQDYKTVSSGSFI